MRWLVSWPLALSCAAVLTWPVLSAQAQSLSPFSNAQPGSLPVPWRAVGLPQGRAPLASFVVAELDGQRVLKLETDASYGTAVHELPHTVIGAGTQLRWRWRLDQAVEGANLRTREGDDGPLKVCAMFDMPLDKLGFWERNLLRLARALSGEKLPAATLCYVWDAREPPGALLPNAYTPRLRFIVADSGAARLRQWQTHSRDLLADLQRAFGSEFDAVPPLVAIVIGADSDNMRGKSLGWVGDVSLWP